jgi:hypothetical protein
VRRDPVDEHADARRVTGVHEGAEVVGASLAGARRIVRAHLNQASLVASASRSFLVEQLRCETPRHSLVTVT